MKERAHLGHWFDRDDAHTGVDQLSCESADSSAEFENRLTHVGFDKALDQTQVVNRPRTLIGVSALPVSGGCCVRSTNSMLADTGRAPADLR